MESVAAAEFSGTDAWLLLACSALEGGDLRDVIAAADAANHAIPTASELNGAMSRFLAAGLFSESGGALRPTPAAAALLAELDGRRGPPWQHFDWLRDRMNARVTLGSVPAREWFAAEAVAAAYARSAQGETPPASVDAYLARVGDRQRTALEQLRAMIRAAAPEAREFLCDGLPAVRAGDRLLVGFGVSGEDCVLYPLGGAPRGAMPADGIRRGVIRFRSDAPLPASLVRKLVVARLKANQVQQAHPG